MKVIQEKRDELYQLCAKYRVAKLYLFGSVLTENFDAITSDIDFLVELAPMSPVERGENLMGLWSGLENLFERKIDLLTEESVKNPYLRQELERTRKLIYDQQSQKIFV